MTVVLRADVSTTDSEEAMVLLDERSGRYWQLNGTGAFILRALLSGATQQETTTDLAARYRLPPGQAEADVAGLIEHLREAGLVVVSA